MSEYSPFLNTSRYYSTLLTIFSFRYAVVTGANKGIGFEICKQLASHDGVTVILTARDPTRGREAVERLSQSPGLAGRLLFHQLDVADAASVAALAGFVKSKFGRLDILVNNAGVGGVLIDVDAYKARAAAAVESVPEDIFDGTTIPTYELSEACINTNYYGVKRVTEALLQLLQSSDSSRVVNVSSVFGKLMMISNEWAREILDNIEELTEDKIDEVINAFLQDFKDGSLAEKGWRTVMPAYTVSKATLNAYTRLLAKKYPLMNINCVHPGFVRTDITLNVGNLTPEESASSVVRIALMPNGNTGLFFDPDGATSF